MLLFPAVFGTAQTASAADFNKIFGTWAFAGSTPNPNMPGTPHGVPGIFGFGVDPANAHVPKILLKSAADAVWAVPKTAGKRSIASNRVEFFNCAPDLMPPTHREAKGPGQTAAKPVGRFHPARRRSRSRCCS